jgi:DNA polymerase-3 subunit beta
MVRQTLFCASQDASRPTLCGENIRVTENRIEMCAIDGFRIAYSEMEINYDGDGFNMIVPSKTLSEMIKLLPASRDIEVTMSFDERRIWLVFEGSKVFSRLIEGNFPDYDKPFSETMKLSTKIHRLDLLCGIERAALISNRQTHVKLEIDDGSMKISSATQIGSMNEDLDIELDGDSMTIGFNPHFIMDVLKVINDEKVEIDFSGPRTPCIIRSASGSNNKYLVLPIRLQSAEMAGSGSMAKAA